ncbi:WecB/TagA/CpsF family glycosyltransferase [Candidatus Leptofilum sp.]|uniref:WecB/TagA/CpsF family glycosyltransferase n=1 Tax=Candidatus Leptofilum sp. TaxID=3241576 RepID=UPI003B5AC704
MMVEKVNVLGVGINDLNLDKTIQIITRWIQEKGQSHYVCVTGVHGVMESQQNESLRQIHNQASLVTPDGMPMVWLGRFRGHRDMSRVYGPDLMLALCNSSLKNGIRHYFYGGAEGVPELLASQLEKKFPGLRVVGTYSPPFRPLTIAEDERIVQQINHAKPDIVWVGLSTPKQEKWMAEHIEQLQVPVLIGVGAAFDFHAGLKKQAPKWMQRSGLEWLYRLLSEPRRLGRRYLVNNPLFILLALAQIFNLRKYDL